MGTIQSGRAGQLRVRWFRGWHTTLDEALAELPEMPTCPHALFRTLAQHPTVAAKRIALVTDREGPVAVLALRRRRRHWEPVGELAVPEAVAPVRPGMLLAALVATGAYIRVPDFPGEVEAGGTIREVERFETYHVRTDSDFDALWRELRNSDRVRKARNRCERLGDLSLEVDAPGAASWTIAAWERKWSRPYWDIRAAAADMQVAAAYYTAHRRYHAFRLLHRGRPVAGTNWFADGDRLIAHCSYRDPAYDRFNVGVRLDELFFRWSATSRYRVVDLGGEFDYKAKWGRPARVHTNFAVIPRHVALARGALAVWRRTWWLQPGPATEFLPAVRLVLPMAPWADLPPTSIG